MSERAERLYEEARALPPEDRGAFVRGACDGDPELQEELLSLLDEAEAAEAFFDLLGDAVASGSLGGPPPPPELPPGHRVGRYRIVERIGGGGMGTVYRARDTRLERDVALKFLPSWLSTDDEAEDRVLIEARAAAALEHPNICTVHEIGETDEGRPFIAMAFYEGETLKERLRRGPLPVAEAAGVTAQLARGLAAAHARGIVHRDIKPGNVMLTPDGTVKLLDFGLAQTPDVALGGREAIRGTLPYMSPEQIRGEPLDARTDLWSLGVVLYEMLAGVRPFRGGDQPGLLQAILHQDPEPVSERRPDAPEPLARIVERLLRRDPAGRYPDAGELRADLARAVPSAEVPRFAAPRRRRNRAAVVAVAAVVMAMAAGALWLPGRGQQPASAEALRMEAPAILRTAPNPPRHETDVAAYELYLRGSDQTLFRTDDGVRRGIRYFEEAIALDSTYAAAHAGLALMYTVLGLRDDPGRPVGELHGLAEQAALKAVSLDDSLAEAHAALALARLYKDYDFASAEAELKRAIDLDPTVARFHQWLAQLYMQTGRPRQALARARRALELDPLSATAHAELAHALLANGRYDEALARLEAIATLQPRLLRAAPYAAEAYAGKGMWPEAVAALRAQAEQVEPRSLGLYGYMLARAGQQEQALRVRSTVLDRWRRGKSRAFNLVVVNAGLGDFDRAFAWLERSIKDRSVMRPNLHLMEPIFEDLRGDPRFQRLREQLGLRKR